MNSKRLLSASLIALSMGFAAAAPARAAARITIVNANDPGEGFNDPTPVDPIGGNAGTTRGAQRLIAFEYAASIWGSTLDSKAEIFIQSGFFPLPCGGGGAVLGASGPMTALTDFPRAAFPQTYYPIALANKQALMDLLPGPPGSEADDIAAFFNSSLDGPACLGPRGWYYGLDANAGTDIDLVTVLLHEFAHGLGFVSFVDETTGANIDPDNPNITDIFTRNILDTSLGLRWNEMTNEQRQASAVNVRKVVWAGRAVTSAVPRVLRRGTPNLQIVAPEVIAGRYDVGAATFGPPLSSPGISAIVVSALDAADAAGPSTTDACSPLTNAADVSGKLALVDRGFCTFVVKARNAQDAGAVGVIVVDSSPVRPAGDLSGVDPTILIPSVRVTLADGNLIKAELAAGVSATLGIDPDRFAGADAGRRAILNMTDPVQPGSSVSHWDPIASPNQLMEPSLNPDVTHAVDGVDLTLSQLRDVGWYPDRDLDGIPSGWDLCPRSDSRDTVIIGECDSETPNNQLGLGCTISDAITQCAATGRNPLDFTRCTVVLTAILQHLRIIDRDERRSILRCVARSYHP